MSDDSTKSDDASLFLAEMAGVTPLKPDNKVRHRKKPVETLVHTDEELLADDVFSDNEIIDDCPDILSFSRSGLQYSVLKKLCQGKFPIEHALDLHGLTVEQARRELQACLGECEAIGIRHAIIVHGKGFRSREKPVIWCWVPVSTR